VKHLRETFTDEEFEGLKRAKDESGLNWHDFIMTLHRKGGNKKWVTGKNR